MDEQSKAKARQVLTHYLETCGHRKTPERFAILDAVYGFRGLFNIEKLNEELIQQGQRVSRGTLYNTLNLLMELHLIVKYNVLDETLYEAGVVREHCLQICRMCRKFTDVRLPEVVQAVEKARFRRFRTDSFMLYAYGICSNCQAKLTRQKKLKIKK